MQLPKDKLTVLANTKHVKALAKLNQRIGKNVVYEIKCLHCGIPYIGETGRTIGSRMKEHLSMDKQTVFKHIMNHNKRSNKQDNPNPDDITWRIIYNNIKYQGERKCIEAIDLKTFYKPNEYGCIGTIINIKFCTVLTIAFNILKFY